MKQRTETPQASLLIAILEGGTGDQACAGKSQLRPGFLLSTSGVQSSLGLGQWLRPDGSLCPGPEQPPRISPHCTHCWRVHNLGTSQSDRLPANIPLSGRTEQLWKVAHCNRGRSHEQWEELACSSMVTPAQPSPMGHKFRS